MSQDSPPGPLGYSHVYSGKVRELYARSDGLLLFVATDRISAFDHVLPTPIPDKGRILTQMSLWWFDQLADLVPNHLVSLDVPGEFAGRAMLCERLQMLPVENVARGYLTGSGLADYRQAGAVCGVRLPPGLVDGSKLPEPVFTPATKAPAGEHDENIDYAGVSALVGEQTAGELRRLTLAVYSRAATIAAGRGIIVADTKLEFGRRPDGVTVLADEVLTPDSSRLWPARRWRPGGAQPSLDKQYVRDWLTSPQSGWDRAGGDPPPPLPDEVVDRTRATYVAAFEALTGKPFQ